MLKNRSIEQVQLKPREQKLPLSDSIVGSVPVNKLYSNMR